jgi:cytochrome b6
MAFPFPPSLGAQLTTLVLFVHVFSTLLLKAYRKPRELVWLTGFVMLAISIFFGLSGYFLLWDERAFAAVRVATGGAGNLPLIGWLIKGFLRGGLDVTGETLTRFYAFHVAILPLVTIVVTGLHILLVQLHGMTCLSRRRRNREDPSLSFPTSSTRTSSCGSSAWGGRYAGRLFPPEIGRKADPLAPAPENIKPEWYFLFLFQTLKLFPERCWA